MKIKTITIVIICLLFSACGKDMTSSDDISKKTENYMINKNAFLEEIIDYDKQEEKEDIKDEVIKSKEEIKEEIIEEKIDDELAEYRIHMGRIDCKIIDECINLTNTIQKEYGEIITGVNYLPVKTNRDNILGYFIVYHYKDYMIGSQAECLNVGNDIQKRLGEKINSYECRDNLLIITPDYGRSAQ